MTTAKNNKNAFYEADFVTYLLDKGWKQLGEDLFLHDHCALHAVDGVLAIVMQRHRDRLQNLDTMPA